MIQCAMMRSDDIELSDVLDKAPELLKEFDNFLEAFDGLYLALKSPNKFENGNEATEDIDMACQMPHEIVVLSVLRRPLRTSEPAKSNTFWPLIDWKAVWLLKT